MVVELEDFSTIVEPIKTDFSIEVVELPFNLFGDVDQESDEIFEEKEPVLD